MSKMFKSEVDAFDTLIDLQEQTFSQQKVCVLPKDVSTTQPNFFQQNPNKILLVLPYITA